VINPNLVGVLPWVMILCLKKIRIIRIPARDPVKTAQVMAHMWQVQWAGSTYGVVKNVNIVSVRVFGCTGGVPWSRIIAAVEWVIENAEYPAVSNMRIGGWAIDVVDATIESSIATGIHYAVAAGNNGDNACLHSPARTLGVMTVGASQVGDPVPPGDIVLSADGYKERGRWHADLSWTHSGTSANVDVYRDGSVIATSQNNGSYTDATNFRGGGSFTYKVCEAGSNTCSNEVTVEF
jgi:hypothetical protein